jgi:uncharacterized protein Yka (UPF0111/DUF47 family)
MAMKVNDGMPQMADNLMELSANYQEMIRLSHQLNQEMAAKQKELQALQEQVQQPESSTDVHVGKSV